MKPLWKIIIPLFFVLALLLGFIQRQRLADFAFGAKTTTQYFTDSGDKSLEDYYQDGQQISQLSSQQVSTTTFLAVGDINLSRNVAANIKKSNNPDLPFLGMADVLKSTAFNFANLESPIAPSSPIIGGTGMTFAAPVNNAQALKDYNFQILNLANNHTWDQELSGIQKTISTLDGLAIKHEGTGNNLDQAWKPAVITANGIKICFVGATYGTNSGGGTAAKYIANISDSQNLKLAIEKSKSLCDFIIATMHAGVEYTRVANDGQTTFAHEAIDDGADMVIGAHPHWVQPIERYRGKYIFYSLGNFIFDQDWSEETSEGLTLKISLSKTPQNNLQGSTQPAHLDSIELMPIIIKNTAPRAATEQEAKTILGKINQTESVLK